MKRIGELTMTIVTYPTCGKNLASDPYAHHISLKTIISTSRSVPAKRLVTHPLTFPTTMSRFNHFIPRI